VTLDQLIAVLEDIRVRHGGQLLVTVDCNGYDADDCECAGADFRPERQYGASKKIVPPHVAIQSGEPWNQDHPAWTAPK
jgi:hypothetical protein